MKILSKLLGRKDPAGVEPSDEARSLRAHEAIGLARQGQLPVKDMLGRLVASKLLVPLADVPQMDGEKVKSWRPATLSKPDGSQWLVGFTNANLGGTFAKENGYSHAISVDAAWVLEALPPGHGLVINVASDRMFEWSAQGISHYKAEVLARGAS